MTFLVRECYGAQKNTKIRAKECFDEVLNEEFKKNLMCKMKNVITRKKGTQCFESNILTTC
jgi:hypothetical protein